MRGPLGGGFLGSGNVQFPSIGAFVRFDGTQTAYEDLAHTVEAAPPFGRVRSIPMPTPLSGNWIAPSDAERPTKTDSSVLMVPIALDYPLHDCQYLQIATPGVRPADNCTVGISFRPLATYGQQTQALLWDGVAGLGLVGNQIIAYYNGSNQFATGILLGNVGVNLDGPNGAGKEVRAYATFTPSGVDVYVNDNGVISTASLAVSIASTSLGTFKLGFAGTGFGNMIVGQASVSPALTTGQRTALDNYFAFAGVDPAFPLDQAFIGVIGDSIQAPTGTNVPGSWPARIMGYLRDAHPGARMANAAYGGSGVPPLTGNNSTQTKSIDALLSPDRTAPQIVIIDLGTNDIVGDATDAGVDAALAKLYLLADHLVARGAAVALCTVLPRSQGLGSFTQTQINHGIDRWNASLASVGLTHAQYLVDQNVVGSIGEPGVGAAAGASAGAFYVDGIHPTYNGHCSLTPAFWDCVATLLGDPPPAFTGDFAALAVRYKLEEVYAFYRSDLGVTGAQGTGKASWANQFGTSQTMLSDAANGIASPGVGLNGKASLFTDGTTQGGKYIMPAIAAPSATNTLHTWIVGRILAPPAGGVFGGFCGDINSDVGIATDGPNTVQLKLVNGLNTGPKTTTLVALTWYVFRGSFTGSANDQFRVGKITPVQSAAGNSAPLPQRTLFYDGPSLIASEALAAMQLRGPLPIFLSFDGAASKAARTFWSTAIEI